jgi:hypothetical protein
MQVIGDATQPTLWQGRRLTLTGTVAGGRLPSARYRLTADTLYWTEGRLGTRVQEVPLWAVRDAALQQTVTQRARRVGTVTVSLQHPDYRGTPTFVLLEDVEKPRDVTGLINAAARSVRRLRDAGSGR